MTRQTYQPRDAGAHNTTLIRTMGLDHPAEGVYFQKGKEWIKHQVCRHDTFSLVVMERYHFGADSAVYTRQEDYVKINFWLSGRHVTVFDGFGQLEHDTPEIFMTCGPWEMLKMDLLRRDMQLAIVAVCVLRDFFPIHLGIAPEELPEPLRTMVVSESKGHALHRFTFTADLVAATRAILATPVAVRRNPVYSQAKAIELMCLLINCLALERRKSRSTGETNTRQHARLLEARELVSRRYAETLTLEQISREVGLNRVALTSGFRQMFGMSVHDWLQKQRMERVLELLQDPACTISHIAEVVGYGHSCNFSTAFTAYFGCSPQQARSARR